jgi:serine/threonine protein kinase
MVHLKPGDTWETFLNAASARLGTEVGRVFNSQDEIKGVADLVQGDILFAQEASQAISPSSPRTFQGSKLRMLNWIRFTRLALLQCIDGYIVTESINKSKFTETLRARRISDDLPVIIKRIASRPGLNISTLKSCIPEFWSVRHPHFAHLVDILASNDSRRPLGGSRRAKGSRNVEVLATITARQEKSLETVLTEHMKLQKFIPNEQIVAWTTQILKVLQYMHTEMRVAHRNLKLTNILVDKDGFAKVCDVALPKVDPSATAYHMRSMCRNCCALRKGQLVSHSAHVSPEAFDTGCASEKDDIWALGCILTEIVTQKLVSERVSGETLAKSEGAVAQAVAEVAIKDIKLGKLCRVLLDMDPSKRPTASEALWKYMKGLVGVASLDPEALSASDMANVTSLGKSNDVPTLISAILKDGSNQACEAASLRLHEILYYEPAKRQSMLDIYKTPFGSMTGLAVLSHCMAKGSPLAQQRAASATRNALLDDEVEQHVGLPEIQALVAAVIMGTPHTQSNAAAALANVCSTRKQARDNFNAAGGMGALAALIASISSQQMSSTGLLNSSILEAASAVRNACIGHAPNRDDLMKAQAVSSFVKILACDSHVPASLREKQITMHEQVAGALRNACNQHTGNCMQFSEADGVSVMMRLLSSPSVAVQEEVVGLIRNACIGYPGNKDQLTSCGAFWSFVQMLNQASLAANVREEIVSAVHYGTVSHDVNKQSAGEAGLLRSLVAILHPGPSEGTMRAKQEVAACLRIMCDESESNSAEMVKCFGTPGLLELLAKGPMEAKEEAVAAISNACCACAQNLDLISENARADLHDMMLSPHFGDEAKLYAKCILIRWNDNRQRSIRSISVSDVDKDLSLDKRSTPWCPQRTTKGTSELCSVSIDNGTSLSYGKETIPGPVSYPIDRKMHTASLTRLPRIPSRCSKAGVPEMVTWRWPENKSKSQTNSRALGTNSIVSVVSLQTLVSAETIRAVVSTTKL